MSIIIAILIFSLIIIFHEFGHYTLAKKNGIRVEEFCIGFGPTIVGFTKGETKYSIKLLPFGGACMMTGEDGDSTDEKAFNNKSVWARMAVVFAGPAFNFLLAFIMAVVLIGCIGYDPPVLSAVSTESSAEAAGMEAGDRITRIGNEHIVLYREVSNYLSLHPAKADSDIPVTYVRDGVKYQVTLHPKYDAETGRYLLGFVWDGTRTRVGPLKTLAYGAYEVKYWIQVTIDSLRMLVARQVSAENVSGPVGIVSAINSTYQESRKISAFAVFVNMLNISILLSANLGVMNLLPIPALDGGRLVFLIVEAIRGKRVNPEKEGMVHFAGLMVMFALMILVMAHDILMLVRG